MGAGEECVCVRGRSGVEVRGGAMREEPNGEVFLSPRFSSAEPGERQAARGWTLMLLDWTCCTLMLNTDDAGHLIEHL